MNIIELLSDILKAIGEIIGKIIDLILEKTFLQIIIVLWALSHFHTDFFKYSKFGIFINGTDNITTHDKALFSVKDDKEKPVENPKK